MPRGDRTGPRGLGPMTGRAAGYCSGSQVPGYMNPMPGFPGPRFGRGRGWGMGWGRGWGRGWRRFWHPSWQAAPYRAGAYYPHHAYYGVPPYGDPYTAYGPEYQDEASAEEEVEFLNEQAALLKQELDAIQERLEELKKQKVDDEDK